MNWIWYWNTKLCYLSIQWYNKISIWCIINIECSGEECDLINLQPGDLYIIPESYGQYRVVPGSNKLSKNIWEGGLRMDIILGRNILSIFMVTYLPTILMNIINQSTVYIRTDGKYEFIITVNITCMVVLASVYTSVSTSLPSTASIKPVEIWLLVNLAYPFMVIIVTSIQQVHRD